ncbi:MAG: hypothetical protein BWY31_01399 [Lentisphaerae bacterium ADurb.Bin242]|nr:MAG: hypothetical protein BWY31_01399 [Lentisphaerae bacterium ADurb.Bin242]
MLSKNTVVMAGSPDYAWGAWLCIASMRKSGMNDPVLVCANGWSSQWEKCLASFGDVSFHEMPPDDRNVCCNKAHAMLQADQSEYVTWVDCDAVFSGNCSSMLLPPDEDSVRIRRRSPQDNNKVMARFYDETEEKDGIPRAILKRWQEDVNDLTSPRCKYAATSGVIGLHRKYRPFLELWHAQMIKILIDTKDVVNTKDPSYFLTDESVLNSLLFFSSKAPKMSERYLLDENPDARYAHYSLSPKPWCMWHPIQLNKYDLTMNIIDWALEHDHVPPFKLPFPLQKKNRSFVFRCARVAPYYAKLRRLYKRFF